MFQSLKGILSDLDVNEWAEKMQLPVFQSLKGILSDLDTIE